MDVSLGLGFDAWEVEASAYAEDRRPTASPPHQTSGEGSPWGSLGDQRPRRPIPKSQTPFSTGIAEALSLSLFGMFLN